MTIRPSIPRLKLERIIILTGVDAVKVSLSSIALSFIIFSGFLLLEGASPLDAYNNIFSFAFNPSLGLPTSIHRGTFIIFSTLAFILPLAAGIWNIGMEGQFYLGTIGSFWVAYSLPHLPPIVLIPLMLVVGALFGAGYGAFAGFLKGKLNVNEVVTTIVLNNIAIWIVNLMTFVGPWAGIA